MFQAQTVVSLSRIDELRGISRPPDGGLRIGALTTIAEVASNPVVQEKYAALAQAAAVVASPQLRNQGTIGGNLCQRPRCWYFRGDYDCARKGGDMCYALAGQNQYHCIFGGGACVVVHPSDTAPALMALEAAVRLVGPEGQPERPDREVLRPAAKDVTRETVLEPGEVLVEVLVPRPAAGTDQLVPQGAGARVVGLCDGRAWRWPSSFKPAKVETARIVLSGVAPMPWRSLNVEQAILGQKLDAKTIATPPRRRRRAPSRSLRTATRSISCAGWWRRRCSVSRLLRPRAAGTPSSPSSRYLSQPYGREGAAA